MCKDEFTEGNGWQEQLYVREARRMVSDYVMTQHNCQGRVEAEDAVGLAAYGMDSHHVQRYVNAARATCKTKATSRWADSRRTRSATVRSCPRADQCGNLLVPVCVSATHIAFGSIRMEPVFMVLGQSAATAAAHAIDENVPVQRIEYPKLRERLLADKQILVWTGPKRSGPAVGLDPAKLPGRVIDDEQAALQGFATVANIVGPFVASGYRHDGNTDKGQQSARFPIRVEKDGKYEVRVGYSAHANRATNVPVKVQHAGGETTVKINQKEPPPFDQLFQTAGQYEFKAGQEYSVEITNHNTDGYVVVDAVQLLPAAE